MMNTIEAFLRRWGRDGFGRVTQSGLFCRIPEGYVRDSADCNDDMATVYPDAPEICDGVDNDCDDLIDDMIQHRSLNGKCVLHRPR